MSPPSHHLVVSNCIPLFFAALLVQVLLFSDAIAATPWALQYGRFAYAGSLLIVLSAVAFNRHLPGMWVVFVGACLNFLVIAANGGQMPVDIAAQASLAKMPAAGEGLAAARFSNVAPLTAESRLWFLGDILATPAWLPLRNVFSVGDVWIALGAAHLIQAPLAAPPPRA